MVVSACRSLEPAQPLEQSSGTITITVCAAPIQDDSMDYECVLDIENQSVVVEAAVEQDVSQPSIFIITCLPHQVRNAQSLW